MAGLVMDGDAMLRVQRPEATSRRNSAHRRSLLARTARRKAGQALVGGDGLASGEALAERYRPAALDQVVGPVACASEMIERPVTRSPIAPGEQLGTVADGSMARFTGAVVAGQLHRGKQLFDTMAMVGLPGTSAGELGSVVGLADQGSPELAVEAVEDRLYRIGGVALQRFRGDQEPGGEIADIQDVAELAVDGGIGLPDVGGPDRARRRPDAGPEGVPQLITQLQAALPGDRAAGAPGGVREISH